MTSHPERDLVVVGASSGGVAALRTLLGSLPDPLGAAVMIVQHCHPGARPMLAEVLRPVSALPVAVAEHDQSIEPDRVFLAPPDLHLLIEGGHVRLSRGPRENMARPAIDTLFRSAAVERGARTIGVVLTGQLFDGAAGLAAIKRCGGITVVQDPRDAHYPEMPTAALAGAPVDHCLPVDEIGRLIGRLAGEPAGAQPEVPDELRLESRMAALEALSVASEHRIGTFSGLSCPDCQGPLWEIRDGGAIRFRCHVGHAFSAEAAMEQQAREVERAMWVALRILRERAALAERAADEAQGRKQSQLAELWKVRADETAEHVRTLGSVLMQGIGQPERSAWSSHRGAREGSPPSPEVGAIPEPDPA